MAGTCDELHSCKAKGTCDASIILRKKKRRKKGTRRNTVASEKLNALSPSEGTVSQTLV